MGRARRQDAEAVLAGEPTPLLPERCLANPGVTLEQQCLPAVGHSTQEAIERQQLFTPAYEVDWHRTLFRRAIAPRLRFAYTRSLPRRTDNRRSHSGPGASG